MIKRTVLLKINGTVLPMSGSRVTALFWDHRPMDQCFHVLFVRPNGWSYEMWPRAAGEIEAVATADALLEYLERIAISDYLEPDGISVRSDSGSVRWPSHQEPTCTYGSLALHAARDTSMSLMRDAAVPDHVVAHWHGHDEAVMRRSLFAC